jgi:WD40 repeat protein/transcriptional regulator with XRE-family HTH domain
MSTQSLSPESFQSFGDLLKYLRRRERLTQLELSIKVGYSEAQISRLEQNQRLPDLAALKALFIPALHLENELELTDRFMQLAQSARQEDAPVAGVPPYKGLLFFDQADSNLFFGRETLTTQLSKRITDLATNTSSRFLTVVGASGSGKSSLVRAGLAVTLRSAGWEIHILTPTTNPLRMLAQSYNPTRVKDRKQHLIVVDQFEETFTLCRDENERAAFIERLLAIAHDKSLNTTVVIALRADFYSHCAQYPFLREAVAAQQEYIGQMTSFELRRAIEEPARRSGWEFESGLVDILLNDIGADGTGQRESGALPLLSHALLATWERRRGKTFTLDGYRASGGVRGAIAETAESVFTDQLNRSQQELARDIFLRLTELGDGTEDTRRRATLNELTRQSEEATQLRMVLNTLADARLITLNEDSAEVAHEALIREWDRLHEWLTQDRGGLLLHRQITDAAHEWELFGRDGGSLYRGARLAQAREWASSNEERLNESERAFISASIDFEQHEQAEREAQQQRELAAAQKLAESEHRSARQLRRRALFLVGALALAVLAALTAGFLANRNSTLAEQNASIARTAQADFNQSEAQRLAVEANSLKLTNGDANLVALLAIQSLNTQYTASGDALLTSLTTLQTPPREFKGHAADLWNGDFSPDGKYLVTSSSDKTARIWDLAAGKTIHVFSDGNNGLEWVAFSPNGKYIVTADGSGNSARLWDVASGQTIRIFSGHTGIVYAAAFSPDGKLIVTVSGDKTARIWDVATGNTLHVLTGHTDWAVRTAFSPDGKYVVTASADRTARLWDVSTGNTVQVFSVAGDKEYTECVSFSPDGNYIATCNTDKAGHTVARIWDVLTGQVVHEFSGHRGLVHGASFSPDGQLLLTAADDGTARLWDIATGQALRIFSGHHNAVQTATFSPDGTLVATTSNDGIARVWNLQTFPGGVQFSTHGVVIQQASFSPDGKRVVTANQDGTAQIWDAVTGQTLITLTGHMYAVKGAVFSPDGKMVLTTSDDNTARLWDAKNGKELLRLEGHSGTVYRGVFSPDGKYIVTTSWDGTARTWDTRTGQSIVTYSKQGPGRINRVAFSPDGKTVVTSAEDGTARIWDHLTGKDLMIFKEQTAIVTGVAFSPDGQYLLTASGDGTLRLWDTYTGKEIRRFSGHAGRALGVAFSPDGKYVLSSGDDATARLWEVSTGKEVRRFMGHDGSVGNVAFSPDGKYILTASEDGTARLWLTSLDDTIRGVCAILTRDLTSDERTQFGISDQDPTCPKQ